MNASVESFSSPPPSPSSKLFRALQYQDALPDLTGLPSPRLVLANLRQAGEISLWRTTGISTFHSPVVLRRQTAYGFLDISLSARLLGHLAFSRVCAFWLLFGSSAHRQEACCLLFSLSAEMGNLGEEGARSVSS